MTDHITGHISSLNGGCGDHSCHVSGNGSIHLGDSIHSEHSNLDIGVHGNMATNGHHVVGGGGIDLTYHPSPDIGITAGSFGNTLGDGGFMIGGSISF